MGNHILFSLVFLNAINFSSHRASTDVFFDGLAGTTRGSFERMFAAGPFQPLSTAFFARSQGNQDQESSALFNRPEQLLIDMQKKSSATELFSEGRANSADSATKDTPPTLSHSTSLTKSMQHPKLEGWELVESADVVECTWPADLDVGVPNQ